MSTATRYKKIRSRLNEVCRASGRKPEDVLLLAVSKTVDLDQVEIAIQAGAHSFGENRPDELKRKQQAFPEERWHFIGNIQSRHIKDIVSAADLIHSVVKVDHLRRIDEAAVRCGKVQRILFEVNVSGEESKSGFAPKDVYAALQAAQNFEHLEVCGLMTMAPRADQKVVQATFLGLRNLRDELQERLKNEGSPILLSELSMGMTEDWEQAVPLGATIIRVGRAIFDDAFE